MQKSSYSLYDRKYHLVFCTKYRHRVLTGIMATRVRESTWEIYPAIPPRRDCEWRIKPGACILMLS
ncbi:MAG: transposase [Holosporaceae bacterium]|nr:transposase [Holosporaceae bacterium]